MAGIFNQFKTIIFLSLLTALLLFAGSFFGNGGLVIAFVLALVMNFGSYWFSHKIVLWIYKAKEMKKSEHPEAHEIVREVTRKADLPMPKLYIIDSAQPNAFATGRNEHNAVVAFTTGILSLLNKEELTGVVAHEISHIKNKDMLVTTIAATIAGVISYLAHMAQWAMIFGGGRDDDNSQNIISMLILVIITPIIAMLLQMAISRSREYLADESGAKISRNPKGLASALAKLHKGVQTHPLKKGDQATASLFILNPFSARGVFTLLSTHPPVEERIKRLNEMKV